MKEATASDEDSVVLRPSLIQRICPLVWVPFGVTHLLTATPGELLWVLSGIMTIIVTVSWLALHWRRDVMTPSTLIQRRLFRTRAYPLHELTLHERKKHVQLRHDGGRLLLYLPRGKAKLSWRYEPSLPWTAALESMQSFLDDAKPSSGA